MGWIMNLCLMNMKRRKIRTFLTVLGVTIGVVSVVALLSIGIGVKQEMINNIVDSGTVNQIQVDSQTSGKHKDRMITDRTLESFGKIDGVSEVYPQTEIGVLLTYGKYTLYTELVGIPKEQLDKLELTSTSCSVESERNPVLIFGSAIGSMLYNETSGISYEKTENKDTTALIGEQFVMSFLEDENNKGFRVKIGGVISATDEDTTTDMLSTSDDEEEDSLFDSYNEDSYKVYCDLDALTSLLKRNSENGVILGQPLTADGGNYSEYIYSSAIVKVEDLDEVDNLVKKFQDMGYETSNSKEYLNTVQKYLKIFQLLIGGIGAIALVVAVIGISNTMTTSVFDRINEIGILKVLGCDPDELTLLFLLEAGIIGFAGGVLGVGISYLTKFGIDKAAVAIFKLSKGTVVSVIPWWLVVTAIVGATILGIVAGFFPAKWASRQNPIDAVRAR